MKKLITLAALLGLMLVLAAPAMAQGDDTPNCKPGDVLESGLCDPNSGPNSAIQGAPGTASPAASASPSSAGPCRGDTPFEATLAGDPGEGSLQCFATQAEANAYRQGGASSSSASASAYSSATSATASPSTTPSPAASQSASSSATPEPSTSQYSATPQAGQLPNTGGTSLLALAAGVTILVFVASLGSAFLVRQRS